MVTVPTSPPPADVGHREQIAEPAASEQVLADLSLAQREAVLSTEGPVLLIAGPGAGKTLTLVRRTVHILEQGLAGPEEIVLCTFTEKAAFELRDRLRASVREAGLDVDLSGLRTGTIHGICNELVDRYRHLTSLGNGYEVLDELTQLLFVFEHFDNIIGPEVDDGRFLGRWTTKWTAIRGATRYFDKITEELVDPAELEVSDDPFVAKLGRSYSAYEAALLDSNRTDFAHLQSLVLDILGDPEVGSGVTDPIRYVMVDEYQDTNFVQEQLLTKLAANGNLCVVGDEDQGLYRFRGATVRNILEFPDRFPGCAVIKLTTNYRSHGRIVSAYDKFMATADWTNRAGGTSFRFDKTITPDPDAKFPEYPAVLSIWGTSRKDEGKRFAELVAFLKTQKVIRDYSQVALLLHSVRSDHSGHYLAALDQAGIPYFCPRARSYFDNDEVVAMVGCLALILGYHGDNRGDVAGRAQRELADYVDAALVELGRRFGGQHPLARKLQEFANEIDALGEEDTLDRRPADYLFELLGVEPFVDWLGNENRARNLATLSQLINTFQRYYHFNVITGRNLRWVRMSLFNSFFRLLHSGGINEYEDPDLPFPQGHVQVMTIHQAKGLEFPVVVVGSLAVQLSSSKDIDRVLGPWYRRPPYEPENRITEFDRMRLHYVAFSRPERLLVLTSTDDPKPHFASIWEGLPQWPRVEKDLIAAQGWDYQPRIVPKKSFSFTGDLKVYETCPRQYEMYRHYDFTPSRSSVIFFGLLVHQTIEDIHRHALAGRLDELGENRIEHLFDANFRHLAQQDVRPIGDTARASALRQVLNYFHENLSEFSRVIDTEVDVSLEKDDYILTGAIDLLLGDDGKLELLDFKAQKRPDVAHPVVQTYYQQLCIYAHILEARHGRRPDRLLLYWTGEPTRATALMEFAYKPQDVAAAAKHFDEVVGLIRAQDFDVSVMPDRSVCKECDFRPYCTSVGTLDPKASF